MGFMPINFETTKSNSNVMFKLYLDFLIFINLDYVMVARLGGDKPYPLAKASMQSPMLDLDREHCMTFRYFIRSNLTILYRAKSEFVGTVLFQVKIFHMWHFNLGERQRKA